MTANTTPFTLRSVAGLPMKPGPLTEAAVVIIDAQEEYGPSGRLPLEDLSAAVDRAAELVAAARKAGAPVIHIVHQGSAGGMFDPASGGRILAELAPSDGEAVITKTLPNAFAGTGLVSHLDSLGNPPLVLAGFMTHMCVSTSARAALDLGFSTVVAGDATATRSLPSSDRTSDLPIPALDVQRASLAAIADRFSLVSTVDELITY